MRILAVELINLTQDNAPARSGRYHVRMTYLTSTSDKPHSGEVQQVAIVTGATSGIGREITVLLATAGWRVFAVGRSAQALAELEQSFPTITPVAFDLRDFARLEMLVDSIMNQTDHVDLLMNSAAIQVNKTFGDAGTGPDDIRQEILVNLTVPITLTAQILPFMLDADAGTIVNLSSGLALVPKRTAAVYCATKAGLSMFSQALGTQLKPHRVSVIDVILPLVETPMTSGRGRGMMSARDAGKAILKTANGSSRRVYIGKARLLRWLSHWLPWVARSIIQSSD
jgi:uncharacterized oxidoreductase